MEVESDAALDERDQRLVMSILRIYRNFQGLLDYSERDTLTGLLNLASMAVTLLARRAMAIVIRPGPHPRSNTVSVGAVSKQSI